MKRAVLFAWVLLSGSLAWSQSDSSNWKDRLSHRGYLKDLRIYLISPDSGGTNLQQNFLHHRMNLAYNGKRNFSLNAELRSRLFYGELTRISGQGFFDQLNADPGAFDLSFNLMERRNAVLNTTLDRLWATWYNDAWEVRLGRQRINWGVNLVWNPNDLFNVLNYADFDYEERPGSDALRITRQLGHMSQLEFVESFSSLESDYWEQSTTALLYRTNKWQYDWQFLAAKYQQDAALGMGLAGNIRDAGLKAEATLLRPLENFQDTFTGIIASVSADYAFLNGLYIQGSCLYNSYGESQLDLSNFAAATGNAQLAVKDLMPNKISFFYQGGYSINPLWRADLSVIHALDMDAVFLLSSLSYSIRQDLDLLLVDQSFFANQSSGWEDLGHSLFLRLKWSF